MTETLKIELNAHDIAKLVAEKYEVSTKDIKYHYSYYHGDAREPQYINFIVEIDTNVI